jgi:archaellum component FlaC
MTIDERIEALTHRHEALTMNVELISRDVEALRESTRELRAATEKQGEHISRVLTIVENLARIAESHERRLDHLEGE